MFLDLPSSERFLRTFFPTSVEVVHLTKRPLTRLCENFITSINSYTAHLRCKSRLKAFNFILSECASSSNGGQCVLFFLWTTQSLRQFLFFLILLSNESRNCSSARWERVLLQSSNNSNRGKKDFHDVIGFNKPLMFPYFGWSLS